MSGHVTEKLIFLIFQMETRVNMGDRQIGRGYDGAKSQGIC